MINLSEKLINTYSTLVKLYPLHFQEEYGEEIITVFRKACIDASKISTWFACKLLIRELFDLPSNLIRQHWSEIWRKPMNTNNNFQTTFTNSILRGIISYSGGIALFFLIFCVFDTLINGGNNEFQGKSLWNGTTFIIHPTALAYGFGALIMGLKIDKKKAWFSAIGTFLIFTLLYRISLLIPLEQHNALIKTGLEPYIFSTIFGVFIGGTIGFIQQGWKRIGWFVIGGVVGFNLGWVARYFAANFLLNIWESTGIRNSIKVGDPWYFILTITPALIYGIIVGIFMGLSTARVHKQPQQILQS